MLPNLPPDVEKQIEHVVATGQYTDAADVVTQAIVLLTARETKLLKLRAMIALGTEQEAHGETAMYTPELFAQIKKNAHAKVKAGHTPHPDVCP